MGASYFGVLSLRQGMNWIQVLLFISQLLDLYPAITEAGYQCEMSISDASAALGTASQIACWIGQETRPWMVCKLDAVFNAFSAIIEQVSLFFGIMIISSPKPGLTYVKMVRYLSIMSGFASLGTMVFAAVSYVEGKDFTSACVFSVTSQEENDAAEMSKMALDIVLREALLIVLLLGLIWGTYAIEPVLKRGGTGDERIEDSDVLSIVKKNPPKILVLSSAFGVASLRGSSLVLCMVVLALAAFNGFSNAVRMASWCGSFDMEDDWCVWPYGVVSMAEQVASILLAIYTVLSLLRVGEVKKLPPLSKLWSLFTVTCFALTCTALALCAFKYPSYWMSGMKRDFWVYYARFWLSLTIFFQMRSIKLIRFAGGVGWEDEKAAKDLVYENLSEDKGLEEVSASGDSLNDMLGLSASIAPRQVTYQEDAPSEESSSGIATPTTTLLMGGSVAAMPNQAVDGVTLGQR